MNKSAVMVYKLAWIKCALMTVAAGMAAFTTAMAGVKWNDLDGTEAVCVVFGCIGTMILVVVAFLDRTISRIENEQRQIPGTPENLVATKTEK
jgi:uncharacterized membrane protein YidH (DUF202 family)